MKISACMIIKNESDMLPRCLESIRWVDEIICVDTGSTDNSVDIAKKYGAKVYIHPWQNDFSLHRNQSVDYSDGDWFLTIDADEVLIPMCDPKNIRGYLSELPDNISSLVSEMIEINNGKKTISWFCNRFFRRKDFIGFENIVHNEPIFKNQAEITDIKFHHYGYSLSPEKLQIKINRTKNLLKKRVENNPEDYIAYLYLVQTTFYEEKFIELEHYFSMYFSVANEKKDYRYHDIAYFFMCLCQIHKDDANKAYYWCKKGLAESKNNIDLNCLMFKICFELGFKKEHKKYKNKYLLEYVKMKKFNQMGLLCFFGNQIGA